MKIQKLAVILAAVMVLSACGVQTSDETAKQTKEYIKDLPVITDGIYPESFDLRDYGYVTPVKLQNPFGYCWAFASTAAAETSILSELQKTYDEYPLDLSEHHLAWFSKQHIPAEGEDGYDSSNSQSGEGSYTSGWTSNSWNDGGDTTYALEAFSAGIGAALEETSPYKGKEGKISYVDSQGQLSDDKPLFGGTAYCYSENDDWSVDESLRYSRIYDLEAGYILPDLKADGDKLNEEGIAAVKKMLTEGRGVAVEYTSTSADGSDGYLNETTFAHYTYEEASTDHCVTIVGWDDNYSRENFNSNNPLPAGNGAWIVKNSWGSKEADFPNYGEWGVSGSGYFYISYYDKSLSTAVAFNFDIETSYDITQQYDLMISSAINTYNSDSKVMTANIFEAEDDMELKAVSNICSGQDMLVTYQVYLLNDDLEGPEDGTLCAELSKTYDYAGYYRETLENFVSVSKGQKYSVVVTQYQESSHEYWYQYDESLSGEGSIIAAFSNDHYVGIVNEGESSIYFEDSGWKDFKQYLSEINAGSEDMLADDNFAIKAFADRK